MQANFVLLLSLSWAGLCSPIPAVSGCLFFGRHWRTTTSFRPCQVWTQESWRTHKGQISSRPSWSAPGVPVPTCAQSLLLRCRRWSCGLEPEPRIWSPKNFWIFFFFSKIWVWVKYYRLPCLWDGATPETGTWNPSQFLGASSPSMSSSCLRRSCLWRGDVAGDVASSVQVAFHNVTLRHENKALAISQISQHLGRDFSVTQVQILYVNFLVDSFSY